MSEKMLHNSEVAQMPTGEEPPKDWHTIALERAEESEITGEPLSIIFLDLNYFKEVNDTLGHLTGDEVIAEVGQIIEALKLKLRIHDPKKRHLDEVHVYQTKVREDLVNVNINGVELNVDNVGGDEFAILANTSEAGAQVLVKRLRVAFADYLTKRPELQRVGLGVAIGKSTLRVDKNMTPAELLKITLSEADYDMYQDKFNQMVAYTPGQEEALKEEEKSLLEKGVRLREIDRYWRQKREAMERDPSYLKLF